MPKIVNHEQMRQGILMVCFELFAKRGYEAVSVKDIAKAANVSTGTLYHYFKNKQAIFHALAEMAVDNDIGDAQVSMAGSVTNRDRLESYVSFIKSREEFMIAEMLLITDFYRQKDLLDNQELLNKIGQKMKAQIASFINSDESELIDFSLSFFMGLIMQRMLFGKEISFEKTSNLYIELIEIYLNSKIEGEK